MRVVSDREKPIVPHIPDRIMLRHRETGELSHHYVVDCREILADHGGVYELANENDITILSGASAKAKPEPQPARPQAG